MKEDDSKKASDDSHSEGEGTRGNGSESGSPEEPSLTVIIDGTGHRTSDEVHCEASDLGEVETPVQALSNSPISQLSLFSRVRNVIPVLRVSKKVAPAVSEEIDRQQDEVDPSSDQTNDTHAKTKQSRFKKAAKRIQLVQGLASQNILQRIREEHARQDSTVLDALSALLSSEATTSELARISFHPSLLKKEVQRQQKKQQEQRNEKLRKLQARSKGQGQGRRPSVEQFMQSREVEAQRQRDAHREMLGFGMPQDEFMHSLELLDSDIKSNQVPEPPRFPPASHETWAAVNAVCVDLLAAVHHSHTMLILDT
jgi:hypothetical protein